MCFIYISRWDCPCIIVFFFILPFDCPFDLLDNFLNLTSTNKFSHLTNYQACSCSICSTLKGNRPVDSSSIILFYNNSWHTCLIAYLFIYIFYNSLVYNLNIQGYVLNYIFLNIYQYSASDTWIFVEWVNVVGLMFVMHWINSFNPLTDVLPTWVTKNIRSYLEWKIIICKCIGCLYLMSIEVCTNRDTLTYREVTVSIVVNGLINKYCKFIRN